MKIMNTRFNLITFETLKREQLMHSLHKKLSIKENKKIIFLNSPEEFDSKIFPLPEGCKYIKQLRGKIDLILAFVSKRKEIERISDKIINILSDEGILWIAYPKKSSGIETDLNRDRCWDIFSAYDHRPVNMISLDDEWSAMRFKPEKTISQKYRNVQTSDNFKKYIDIKNKIVKAPEDLVRLFKQKKNAEAYFESLSYTHKKEYVQWIIEAKRSETRERRVKKTIEMLKAGKKNPNDK